jgi:hypothetical protein
MVHMPVMDENTRNGKPRRVGVELEFGGMDLPEITRRIAAAVGGKVAHKSAYAAVVSDTPVGTIRVELDALLFREFKVRGFLKQLPLAGKHSDLAGLAEKALASEARRFVPFEVVFDPLPFDRIGELEPIRAALAADAEGTGASVYNAFGLHFNPELPMTDAATVLVWLRAFLVLYERLKRWHAVDSTRRISPFIDPFPKDYALRVLDSGYKPDQAQLVDDYLESNPTRNRPLDLLPILAHLDQERIRRQLPDEKINPRPTLHYRLPNCSIDDPEWTIGREWRIWMRVEELATDPRALTAAMARQRYRLEHPWRAALLSWWNARLRK